MDEPYEIAAYTDIGRAVVAWGHFEQTIISFTWRSRDPHHKSPFRQGSIEPGFYKRWLEWCRIFGADDTFRADVLKLSDMRDDLCHNIADITAWNDRYSLMIFRRHLDWRKSFTKWVSKYAHLHWRARPATPVDQQALSYSPRNVADFLSAVTAAEARAKDHSEAWLRARQS